MKNIDGLIEKVRVRRRLPDPERCRRIRLRAGLPQVDLARVIGVSRETICRWETGARRPSGRQLIAYVEVLDRLAAELAQRVPA